MLYTDKMIREILSSSLSDSEIDKHILENLISKFTPKEDIVEKKDKVNYYKNKLETLIPTHSCSCADSILEMFASKYEDYSLTENGYIFKNRSCLKRENIMFEKKDIKKYINKKLELWISNHSKFELCEDLKKATKDSIIMNVYMSSNSSLRLRLYVIKEHTLSQPYYITRLNGDSKQKFFIKENELKKLDNIKVEESCSGFYAFNTKDINKIIKLIEDFYSQYYK